MEGDQRRAVTGEPVRVCVDRIKADRRDDYRRFLDEVKAPAVRGVRPEAHRSVRLLEPTSPNPDGTWSGLECVVGHRSPPGLVGRERRRGANGARVPLYVRPAACARRRDERQMSSRAPAHQAGGAGIGSSVGLVFEGPCTGGAASFTFAWRATTASSVTLNTVRSCVTVTGPW